MIFFRINRNLDNVYLIGQDLTIKISGVWCVWIWFSPMESKPSFFAEKVGVGVIFVDDCGICWSSQICEGSRLKKKVFAKFEHEHCWQTFRKVWGNQPQTNFVRHPMIKTHVPNLSHVSYVVKKGTPRSAIFLMCLEHEIRNAGADANAQKHMSHPEGKKKWLWIGFSFGGGLSEAGSRTASWNPVVVVLWETPLPLDPCEFRAPFLHHTALYVQAGPALFEKSNSKFLFSFRKFRIKW